MARDRDERSNYAQGVREAKLRRLEPPPTTIQVPPGTSPAQIAADNGVDLQELIRINRGGLPFSTGQTIRIPRGFQEGTGGLGKPVTPQGMPRVNAPKSTGSYPHTSLYERIVGGLGKLFSGKEPADLRYEHTTVYDRTINAANDLFAGLPGNARRPNAPPAYYPGTPPPKPTAPAPRNPKYDASGIDRTGGGRVDPVTGMANNEYGSDLVDAGGGRFVPAVVRFDDKVVQDGASAMGVTKAEFLQKTGYVKFGGTYVFTGSEIAGANSDNYQAVSGENYRPRGWFGAYSIDANGKIHGGNKWRVDKRTGETYPTKRYKKPSLPGQGKGQPQQPQEPQYDEQGNLINSGYTWRV
jgi:hypothetical protein